MDGRAILPKAKEIVAEKSLDDTYDMDVGDIVTITRSDGRDVSLPVVGLAYDVMYDTYRGEQPPYLYVSETTLRSLFPDKATWDRSLGLRLSDPEKVDDVLAEVESMRSLKFIESHTDWHDVKEFGNFQGATGFCLLERLQFICHFGNCVDHHQRRQFHHPFTDQANWHIEGTWFYRWTNPAALCWAVRHLKPDRNYARFFAWAGVGTRANAGRHRIP